MIVFGCVERLSLNVGVSGRVHFRVEIAQPHIDAERCEATAERAVASAWIERNSRQLVRPS
jgi:hypothetical protein